MHFMYSVHNIVLLLLFSGIISHLIIIINILFDINFLSLSLCSFYVFSIIAAVQYVIHSPVKDCGVFFKPNRTTTSCRG